MKTNRNFSAVAEWEQYFRPGAAGSDGAGLLDACRVLSLDVFDTSVLRVTGRPNEVFVLVECELLRRHGDRFIGYAARRFEAELDTMRRIWAKDRSKEATLDDILDTLTRCHPDDTAFREEMRTLELELELEVARPNLPVLELFREAVRLGRRVVFVSDTYLPQAHIERLLDHCGYLGPRTVFVSCEVGKNKATGTLFGHVRQVLGVSAAEILHIGDNTNADHDQALAAGMRSIRVPNPEECLHQETWLTADIYPPHRQADLATTLYVGLLKNELLLPRSVGAEPLQRDADIAFRVGYRLLGPLLLTFCEWIAAQARAEGTRRLYFASREGFFIKQVFEQIAAQRGWDFECRYLLISRRALTLPTLAGRPSEHLKAVLGGVARVGEWLSFLGLDAWGDERLAAAGLTRDSLVDFDASPRTADSAPAAFLRLLDDSADQIEQVAADERSHYLAYLETIGFFAGGQATVIDSGWFGSSQKKLASLVQALRPGYPVRGLYLALHATPQANFSGSSVGLGYLEHLDEFHCGVSQFREMAMLMEMLLAAPHASVRRIEMVAGEIRPHYVRGDDCDLHPVVGSAQGAARAFIDDWLACPLSERAVLPRKLLRKLIWGFMESPDRDAARVLGQVPYEAGSLGQVVFRPFAAPPRNRPGTPWRRYRQHRDAIAATGWRRAYLMNSPTRFDALLIVLSDFTLLSRVPVVGPWAVRGRRVLSGLKRRFRAVRGVPA